MSTGRSTTSRGNTGLQGLRPGDDSLSSGGNSSSNDAILRELKEVQFHLSKLTRQMASQTAAMSTATIKLEGQQRAMSAPQAGYSAAEYHASRVEPFELMEADFTSIKVWVRVLERVRLRVRVGGEGEGESESESEGAHDGEDEGEGEGEGEG